MHSLFQYCQDSNSVSVVCFLSNLCTLESMYGPANCGKTFLLNPLNIVYTTFSNPATTTFAWVGAENADVIFLNKSHFSKDVALSGDVPIFCTAKEEITYVRGGVLDATETQMMRVRWNVFSFHAPIPTEKQVELASCPRCFAELVLQEQ